jgi:hypothetical protein
MRKRMAESLKMFSAGETPLGLDPAIAYGEIRSAQGVIPKDAPWQRLLEREVETAAT